MNRRDCRYSLLVNGDLKSAETIAGTIGASVIWYCLMDLRYKPRSNLRIR